VFVQLHISIYTNTHVSAFGSAEDLCAHAGVLWSRRQFRWLSVAHESTLVLARHQLNCCKIPVSNPLYAVLNAYCSERAASRWNMFGDEAVQPSGVKVATRDCAPDEHAAHETICRPFVTPSRLVPSASLHPYPMHFLSHRGYRFVASR
jgi:hypothetical protein